jgi:hypothetical protein
MYKELLVLNALFVVSQGMGSQEIPDFAKPTEFVLHYVRKSKAISLNHFFNTMLTGSSDWKKKFEQEQEAQETTEYHHKGHERSNIDDGTGLDAEYTISKKYDQKRSTANVTIYSDITIRASVTNPSKIEEIDRDWQEKELWKEHQEEIKDSHSQCKLISEIKYFSHDHKAVRIDYNLHCRTELADRLFMFR